MSLLKACEPFTSPALFLELQNLKSSKPASSCTSKFPLSRPAFSNFCILISWGTSLLPHLCQLWPISCHLLWGCCVILILTVQFADKFLEGQNYASMMSLYAPNQASYCQVQSRCTKDPQWISRYVNGCQDGASIKDGTRVWQSKTPTRCVISGNFLCPSWTHATHLSNKKIRKIILNTSSSSVNL